MFSGTGEVAGATGWNMKNQKAYGICISLYEQHPVNGKMSGNVNVTKTHQSNIQQFFTAVKMTIFG